MAVDDERLLIRLPSELKGLFQWLCQSRGVTVSEELRRFMADEVAKSTQGMTTKERRLNSVIAPKKIPAVKKPTKQTKAKSADQPTRCDETNDMFDDPSELARRERIRADIEAKRDKRLQKPQDATQGKMKLSDGVMNGIQNKDKRKKTKK